MDDLDELKSRLSRFARGRGVRVEYDHVDSPLAFDYSVRFEADNGTFLVTLRRGGCFEAAYRDLERAIEAIPEELDGIHSVPDGHSDFRKARFYWIVEKQYVQFRDDLESAIAMKVAQLQRERPPEDQPGAIEIRVRTLQELLVHLRPIDVEIRRGVLSPDARVLLEHVLGHFGVPLFADPTPKHCQGSAGEAQSGPLQTGPP